VLHAPLRRGGIQHASKNKINNLGTDEFVSSNPPFSKIWLKSGGNDGFKRKMKTWNFKKSFKFRNSCEKTFSNNLVFEPMELSPLPP